MSIVYFNERVETMPTEELERVQLKRLQETVSRALKINFYRNKFKKIGIISGEDITSLDDLKMIPYTTKDDLRMGYPGNFMAVDQEEVIRLHASSGTSGFPTVIAHTAHDLEQWNELTARCMTAAGATKKDVFQNMMSYGLFTGGLGLHYGAEKLGMAVIPTGDGHSRRQVQLMRDFKTTIIHATPSYLLHLYYVLQDMKIAISDLSLKKAFLGAEPYTVEVKKRIEELYHIDVYNSYGLSEMNGPGVAFECLYKEGMHIWEDAFIPEIIDPETDKHVADGLEGEIVFTTLTREATPLIRYKTGDIASLDVSQCSCKRTHRRLSRIKGRTDDMFIINGVNIFPGQVESVIMKYPEVGTNYKIFLEKRDSLDKITIRIEVFKEMQKKGIDLYELKKKLEKDLAETLIVHPIVELWDAGSLGVYDGKAARVIDDRKELF